MRFYRGDRGQVDRESGHLTVYVQTTSGEAPPPTWRRPDGDLFGFKIPERQEIVNHSASGFEWGYRGSGPAQLALAILCDHFDVDNRRPLDGPDNDHAKKFARQMHQAFKREVIAGLETSGWTMTSKEIEAWLQTKIPWEALERVVWASIGALRRVGADCIVGTWPMDALDREERAIERILAARKICGLAVEVGAMRVALTHGDPLLPRVPAKISVSWTPHSAPGGERILPVVQFAGQVLDWQEIMDMGGGCLGEEWPERQEAPAHSEACAGAEERKD